jgi:hypothetical protein
MSPHQQFSMESVIGNKVVIQLHRQAYEMLDLQGIESEKFVALVSAVDSFGLWIENPHYTTVPVYDDDGEYIPPEDREEVVHRAIVLLQWPYIQTILQFPERTSFKGSEDEVEIGFKAKLAKPGKERKDG